MAVNIQQIREVTEVVSEAYVAPHDIEDYGTYNEGVAWGIASAIKAVEDPDLTPHEAMEQSGFGDLVEGASKNLLVGALVGSLAVHRLLAAGEKE